MNDDWSELDILTNFGSIFCFVCIRVCAKFWIDRNLELNVDMLICKTNYLKSWINNFEDKVTIVVCESKPSNIQDWQRNVEYIKNLVYFWNYYSCVWITCEIADGDVH